MLEFFGDGYKIHEMYNESVKENPRMLKHVPDQYKTQEMCDKAA